MFVVDASVVLAWVFDDESSAVADSVLGRISREPAAAPAHGPLEIANALRIPERRGRLTSDEVPTVRSLLAALPIEIVPVELTTALYSVLDLAAKHDLSAYDATYLGLAEFRGVPLATVDTRLRSACLAAGVALVG